MTRRVLVSQLALTMLLLALTSAEAQDEKVKPLVSKYGLVVKYRKAGQDEFDVKQKYTMECCDEEQTGNGLYVMSTGALSAVPKALFKTDGKETGVLSQHGLEITVRPADTKAKEKPKFALECFLDENNKNLLYFTETGSLSVVPAKHATATKGKIKGHSLNHGLTVRVRKAGDLDWSKPTTKSYGIDVFEDLNNGNVIYMSETGSVCVLPSATAGASSGKGTAPEWNYGLDLAMRGPTEAKISKDSKRFGIEVFKDTNNGCMIYVVENGNIAVVPSKLAKFLPDKEKSKDPDHKRGFYRAVRGLDEDVFSDKTKKVGIEVYLDENNNNLIYLGENGQITVVPGKDE